MRSILNLYIKSFNNLPLNIWILAVAMFINRSGAMVVIFTSLYLTNEIHLTLSEAGIALSFFGLGSILGSFAGGWLTDRRNFFDIMVFSLFMSGIVLPPFLYVKTIESASVVLFIFAFFSDMFRPAISKGIAFYSNAKNRTRSVALVRLAINLGFTIGPAIGGVIAMYLGYKPLIIIDACTSIFAGILLTYKLPRKNRIPVVQNTPQQETPSVSAYKDWLYLFFIFLVALYGICFFQFFASLQQFLDKVGHYSESTIGWIMGLNGFLVVLIEMPLMAVLENKKTTFNYIIIGALFIPIAFSVIYFGQVSLICVITFTVFLTFSEILAMPFMMNFSLSRPHKSHQGQYAALYSIAYGLAHFFAPRIGLGIADSYNFNTMFMVIILLGVITTLGFLFLKKRLASTNALF